MVDAAVLMAALEPRGVIEAADVFPCCKVEAGFDGVVLDGAVAGLPNWALGLLKDFEADSFTDDLGV